MTAFTRFPRGTQTQIIHRNTVIFHETIHPGNPHQAQLETELQAIKAAMADASQVFWREVRIESAGSHN